jgi:cytoskeletal protein CcmA (bactofilin family)
LLQILLGSVFVLVLLDGAPPQSHATEYVAGTSPTIPADTTVAGDLYLAGGHGRLLGTVARDAVASALQLEVRGAVDGSLSGIAGRTIVAGVVAGSVRLAGAEVIITGDIGGDLIVAGGVVTLGPDAHIRGDVIISSLVATFDGRIDGDIRGQLGWAAMRGVVGGAVEIEADRLHVASDAEIGGNLSYRGRFPALIEPGATIRGEVERRRPAILIRDGDISLALANALLRLLASLLFGVLLISLAPRAASNVADIVRSHPLLSFSTGFLSILLSPPLILLAAVTVVGIPLALVSTAIGASSLYASQVIVGLALGRIMLPNSWDINGRGFNLLAMTIGVLLLGILRMIPVPYLGTVIAALNAVIGVGALIVALCFGNPEQ